MYVVQVWYTMEIMEVLIQQQNNDKLHVHVMCNTKYSIQIDIQIVWWWYQLDNAVLWSLSGLKLSVALFNDFSWLHVYMHMLIWLLWLYINLDLFLQIRCSFVLQPSSKNFFFIDELLLIRSLCTIQSSSGNNECKLS